MALGVLGFLLVAVTLYVFTLNGITSNQDELAQLKAEKSESDSTAGALSGFGDFQVIKATRVTSVKTLADGRLDWERVLLEISRVLPEDVWLTSLEGATAGRRRDFDPRSRAGCRADPDSRRLRDSGRRTWPPRCCVCVRSTAPWT